MSYIHHALCHTKPPYAAPLGLDIISLPTINAPTRLPSCSFSLAPCDSLYSIVDSLSKRCAETGSGYSMRKTQLLSSVQMSHRA